MIVIAYTPSTAFVTTPGRIGQAIKFDGVTASTTVGNVSSSVKSVAFWLKMSTTTSGNIMDLDAAGTNVADVAGTMTARNITSPTIYVDGAVSSAVNDTKWHHVVITTGTAINASSVSLGVASSTYGGFTMDDLRMYSRALSATEVSRLYQLGATSYVNTTSISSVNKNNTNGLVGWWTFDGANMGPTVKDTSGQGNNGNLVNFTSTTTVPGVLGQALKFNSASSQYINAGTLNSGAFQNNFSVALWYKWTSAPSVNYTTMASKDASGTGNGWLIGGKSLTTQFGVTSPSVASIAYDPTPATIGKWYHGVVTVDGSGNWTVYTNGVQVATGSSAPNSAATYSFRIGVDNGGVSLGAYFPGVLDDVRIYNRALSASEVMRLYQLGI